MTSKRSAGKPEVKSGGMKPSASAPSSLPSAKPSHSSLFVDAYDEDDDDLFAPKQEPRYSSLSCVFRTNSAEVFLLKAFVHSLLFRQLPSQKAQSRARCVQSPPYMTSLKQHILVPSRLYHQGCQFLPAWSSRCLKGRLLSASHCFTPKFEDNTGKARGFC